MTENQNPPPADRPDEKAGGRTRPHGKMKRRIAGALAIGLEYTAVRVSGSSQSAKASACR